MSIDARIGIVGLGNQGQSHADRIRSVGATLAAGADVIAGVREAFAAEYGVETYPDAESMYDSADLDGVVVTTPNKFHADAAVPALERDIDVLCEKPLAADLEDAERIADAAAASDAFCMLGFHTRFGAAPRVLKSKVEDGEFGEVRHVEANYMRRRGIPGLGTWFTDEELAGGGSLIDIGVHVLDLALHVLDFPAVVEVSGVTRQDFGGDDYAYLSMWGDSDEDADFTVDDSATALVRCADGSTVTLNVSWAANTDGRAGLQVLGTEAGADFEMYDGNLTLYETEPGSPDRNLDTAVETADTNAGEAEVEAFAAGVAAGEAPDWNTVEQGLAVQRVIDAVYRSSESGHAVRLD